MPREIHGCSAGNAAQKKNSVPDVKFANGLHLWSSIYAQLKVCSYCSSVKLASSLKGFEMASIEEQKQQKSYYVCLGSLSTKLRHRAYLHTLGKLKLCGQSTQEALSQLSQTIDLVGENRYLSLNACFLLTACLEWLPLPRYNSFFLLSPYLGRVDIICSNTFFVRLLSTSLLFFF